MAGNKRVGGIISFKVDGDMYFAKGDFTYNLGKPKREGVVGSDRVHGYKETPQIPFIEGEITDRNEMSLETLLGIKDATITLELANDKVIVLREGWYASEGTVNTGEGNVPARFEGMSAEEVR
ncbi:MULTISPECIES: phage tail tube protein [Pseudomonas chlororaphis group]|uniref:phage tail tube protein n=1 Tax=Pseudomonas chlororaphis group TaxID=136842 RepID=UPI0020983185|nr:MULTISPECIES: phage tail tube protein [Pseudomonas chlororaphis group]MCO7576170.1 phage tail tube protein [Pseudomonas protegens]MCO7580992.1 phage tail tube protein [Pseudomonas chlororaphis]MCO7597983.1 phage tail tube protein [Pseudomonas chlororaphis]